MSLLAEPKRKQRLSVDPQNVQWKNDDQRVSRKLMERMGWSDGDGLGRNRQGCSENVKLKANYTGKGLGADKMASYDSTWIGHHDDFADLLSALNKNKEQKADTEEEKQEKAKKLSLELTSKSLRRRIHYQKFTRAKDTSNYTDNDRTAVLGIGLSRSKAESREKTEPAEQKPDKEATISAAADSNTTVSTLSVAEYFAAKMAALKNKREQAQSADVKKEVDDNVEGDSEKVAESHKKKRKERRISECLKYESASESLEIKVEIVERETVEEDDETMRKQRKKERKLRRKMERERLQESKGELKEPKVELEKDEEDNGTLEAPADNHNKRKRKQERERETAVMEEEACGQEEKKKSKKNKRKRQESE